MYCPFYSLYLQCIDQPPWDRCRQFDSDDEDEDEDENEDEDEAEDVAAADESNQESTSKPAPPPKMWPMPAVDHPEWKWVMLWKSWQLLCDYSIRTKYTNPDHFDMYIYNDFHGYGMMELAENAVSVAPRIVSSGSLINSQIEEFNTERSKNSSSLHLTWAPIAMLGFWLNNNENGQDVIHVDDGERCGELIKLMGIALLTALHDIDRAGKLTKDSELRDIGLVMTTYLEWAHDLDQYGFDDGQMDWLKDVVAYAKKASIDLATVGCQSAAKILENFERVPPLKDDKKADRWNWTKNVSHEIWKHGHEVR